MAIEKQNNGLWNLSRAAYDLLLVARSYQDTEAQLEAISRTRQTKSAVVLHLYYPDMWELFSEKLQALSAVDFDLFITLPKCNIYLTNSIRDKYPNAHILCVPNRGRDVLPFMKVARHLDKLGFEYLLKIHSKKSPHYNGENTWRVEEMLEKLLPNSSNLSALLERLSEPATGLIGPEGYYIPLLVTYPANRTHIHRFLAGMYSQAIADRLDHNCQRYGFFAGTMFWARIDALRPILERPTPLRYFQAENGQTDATFAHALERIFSLVPEIENKKLYELGHDNIRLINYMTDNFPAWATQASEDTQIAELERYIEHLETAVARHVDHEAQVREYVQHLEREISVKNDQTAEVSAYVDHLLSEIAARDRANEIAP